VGCDGAAFWHDRYGHQPPMTAKPGDGRLGLGSRPSWVRPADCSPMRVRDGGDVIGREADIYWGCAAER